LKVFENSEFGKVRVIMKENEPWFVAKDIAGILGYRETNDMTKWLDTDEKITLKQGEFDPEQLALSNKIRLLTIINESGLYNAILRSKKPEAKKFRKCVTSEVLPTIRKTGGYVNNEDLFIETYLPMVDDNVKTLFKQTLEVIRQQNNKIKELNEKIANDEPLVEFANRIAKSSDTIKVRDFAKIMCDNNFNIGEKRLYKYLRNNKIVDSNNIPYQSYIDRGYFVVKEGYIHTPYGSRLYRTTLITPKGQMWLFEKLRKEREDKRM